MSSVAVASRATSWRIEGARRLRASLASELGGLILAFALLRVIAVVNHPASFPDTAGYLDFSLIGDVKRLWTVPLVWNLFPSNDLREAAQLGFGIASWSLLGVTVAGLLSDVWLRRIGTVAILAIGLAPQVTGYDRTLLSESLSSSLLVLVIALLLRTYERPSRGLAAACLTCTTLWVFARDVNVVLFVTLLPFLAVFLLRRGPLRRQACFVAALAVIAAWGLYAISQPGADPVWHQNALEILEDRLAPDPSALAFLYARGLPHSPLINQERGVFPGSSSPLFKDPAMRAWLDHDFKSSYFEYLASHPRYSLLKPFERLPGAVSLPVASGGARTVLPPPAAQLLWGTEQGDLVFWTVVAGALAVLAFAYRAVVQVVPVTALVLLAAGLGAIVVWDLTGNGVGSGSLGRQFMPVAIAVRVGLVLTILTCADGLRRRGAALRAANPPSRC